MVDAFCSNSCGCNTSSVPAPKPKTKNKTLNVVTISLPPTKVLIVEEGPAVGYRLLELSKISSEMPPESPVDGSVLFCSGGGEAGLGILLSVASPCILNNILVPANYNVKLYILKNKIVI